MIAWTVIVILLAVFGVLGWANTELRQQRNDALEFAATQGQIATNLRRINLDLQEELKQIGAFHALRSERARKASRARWGKKVA